MIRKGSRGRAAAATFLTVALLVATTGCGSQGAKPTSDGTTPTATKDPVRIGMTSAITGAYSEYGEAMQKALTLAVEDWNAKGGVASGRKVELIALDDQLNAAKAVTNAQRLLNEDKVHALFLPAGSSPAMAVLPLAVKAGIPTINLVATTPAVVYPKGTGTDPYPNVFNFARQNDIEAAALGKHLGSHWKKIGLLSESTEYGQSAADNIKKYLKQKYNLDVAAWEQYDQKAPDLTPQLGRLQKAGAEVVCTIALGADLATIRKTLDRMGWNVPMVGASGIFSISYLELVGDLAIGAQADILGGFLDPNTLGPSQKAFAQKWKQKYGNDRFYGKGEWPVADFSRQAETYDAANILLSAIDRAGGTEPKAVVDQMDKVKDYEGALGLKFTLTPKIHHAITEDSLVVAQFVKEGSEIVIRPIK